MANVNGHGEHPTDCKAVFVDTNLDTHLAIPVSSVDTVFDVKRKIVAEHSKCFQKLGDIHIHALKVKRKQKLYSLSDLMPVRSVFTGTANSCFLFADITSQFRHYDTEFLPDPALFSGVSLASPLQRAYKKDESNLQTGHLSGEARCENLQLVTNFTTDDNVKSTASDSNERLNALVNEIYDSSCKEGKVTSVILVGKSSDIGSFEKDKIKKKRKISADILSLNGNHSVENGFVDKNSASQRLDIVKNLDQNVADRVPDVRDNEKGATPFVIALESEMKKSKKRKNRGDDGSHQMEVKRNVELGVPNFGDVERGIEMTRPLKGQNTGDDLLDTVKMDRVGVEEAGISNIKVQNQTQKSKKKIKRKQIPAMKNISEFPSRDQSDTMEPEKGESTLSKSACEKADNMESLSSPRKQTDKAAPVVIAEVDSENKVCTKATVDDEVITTKNESVVEHQRGDDETIHNDAQPMQLTQIQKSFEGSEITNSRSRKKTKLNSNTKRDSSKSGCSNTIAEKNDEPELSSVFEEQIEQAASLADANADIEMSNAKGEVVNDQVFVTMQYDVEPEGPEQQSSIQKSEQDNGSKSKKSQKLKKKQSHPLKTMSELSMERTKSTWSRSEAEKDGISSPVIPVKQIDKVSLISASQADAETNTKGRGDAVIITNPGNDVNLQQEADDTCQSDVEPIQPTQARSILNGVDGSRSDTREKDLEIPALKTKDGLKKRSRQVKAVKELQKMKQHQPIIGKSLSKSAKKVVQNPSKKKNSIPKGSSIFKDVSSSSSEDRGGGDASDSTTENLRHDHVSSSDYTEDESRGSWVSPKHGNLENGRSTAHSKSMQKNLTMESILRSSQKFKKAKLLASQLQLEDEETQSPDVVPDSQVNT